MFIRSAGYFILIAVISYCMGSFNGAIITSHFEFKSDVREQGSGNAGLTNFYRNYGKKGLLMVFFIDIIKVIIAVFAGGIIWKNIGPEKIGQVIAMLFAILGHSFPVPFDFRGGKGVLSTCGAVFIIDYHVLIVMALIFLVAVIITRYVSLGSILMVIAMPIVYYILNKDIICTLVMATVSAIIIIMHRGNIKRLIHGKESKLTIRKE